MILTFNCGFGNLLSQSENFKLFGFIYLVFLKRFELFSAWLLEKRASELNLLGEAEHIQPPPVPPSAGT